MNQNRKPAQSKFPPPSRPIHSNIPHIATRLLTKYCALSASPGAWERARKPWRLLPSREMMVAV